MPEFGLASQSADRAQRFELGQVALLDTVDLGQVEEGFIGEFGIGCALQDGEEDPAGGLVVFLADLALLAAE